MLSNLPIDCYFIIQELITDWHCDGGKCLAYQFLLGNSVTSFFDFVALFVKKNKLQIQKFGKRH